MYHEVIKINLLYREDISVDYIFFISKVRYANFSPIKYSELLDKFESIGFNLKYVKFYDIEDDCTVFCNYNYQPNFETFFIAYKKLIFNKPFNIKFQYGNMINGIFYMNNINYFASIEFIDSSKFNSHLGFVKDEIVKGKIHIKTVEFYIILNSDGEVIHEEVTDMSKNFEQHFFENYDVKVYLRKYKLNRLKNIFSE